MAEAIVSIVVGRITDLLTEEALLLHGVRDEIEQVVTELRRIKTFLPDADSRKDRDLIQSLLAEVRELAYDAEHAVESFLVKALVSPGKATQWINTWKFSRKIKDIQSRMSIFFDNFREYSIKSTSESAESSNSSEGATGMLKRFHSFTTVEPELFVGFNRDVDLLVGHLVNESDDCYPLVSICGMGGLGKTTLAQKIYNHSTIKTYFAGLAWVSISQNCQTKLVLQRILICLIPGKKNEILAFDDVTLVENLLQIQETKKCLIVLDDIWSPDAWDSLKDAFKVERSVSKLMLTSRNVEVAEHANPKGFIHRPEYLSADHSWELLRLKARPRGYDPDNTKDAKRREEIGREMLTKCAGLPLAIVILGGILVTKPSLIEWEKVYQDSLSSLKKGKGLGENQQNQLFDILVRSYNELPPQLKPCFLYLGKFNEDEWIDAETLYQLWIAEGMVLSSDKRDGETMMQVAESYMGELVHKSMVQVRFNDSESSLTKFKSCCLHDLMRDLSITQGKAEDFFEAIDLQKGNKFHLSMFANTRRIVVNCHPKYRTIKANSYIVKEPNHQRYRSMLLTNGRECRSVMPVLGSYFANFRLLRVLALEDVHLYRETVSGNRFGTSIGRVIGSLIYLRYLSTRSSNLIIAPWIQKLVLLQTLKLDSTHVIDSPIKSIKTLGKLAHLRHLYLANWGFNTLEKNVKLRLNGLSKLETLQNFNPQFCEVKDLLELTSLHRLTVIADRYYHDLEETLKYLATLALSSTSGVRYWALDLYVSHEGRLDDRSMIRQVFWNDKFHFQELSLRGKLPAELGELFEQQQQLNTNTHIDASLIRITSLILEGSYLEEDPMPVLEKIPTLRDLGLYLGAYEGKEMVCSAMGFPKLTRLLLLDLPNLESWRVEEGSMPILSQLKIRYCLKLEELPEGLVYLKFLQKLILWDMPSKLCDRVRVVNRVQGPDLYKVAHVHLEIVNER